MKLFDEIESEVKGRIVKVLVDDASPAGVYDQPLFSVEPAVRQNYSCYVQKNSDCQTEKARLRYV
jgi:hypothetical protein